MKGLQFPYQAVLIYKCNEGYTYFRNDTFKITSDIYAKNDSIGIWNGSDSLCRGFNFLYILCKSCN